MAKTRYKIEFTLGTGKGFIHIYASSSQNAFNEFFKLPEEDLIACIHLPRVIVSINADDPDLTAG
jgi:hypothetical protein